MNYTAAELFPDWYSKGVSKEVAPEELTLRRQAISAILKIEDTNTWLNFMKVYLGLLKPSSEGYGQIVDKVKAGDENFLIQNENLIRIMSGCVIGQKIDENDSMISDLLALSLITAEILPTIVDPIPDLSSLAYKFWINECESQRKVDLDFKVGSPISSDVKVEIPELSADQTTWKANSDAVIKIIKALQKDLNAANEEIISQQTVLRAVKKNFVALSEETDILWWLFGAYSIRLKKSFSKFNPEFLSVLVSFELYDLTKSNPGIGGIESIIHKALSNTTFEPGSTYTYESIIDSVKEYEKQVTELLPKDHSELEIFTPILFAIRCRVQHAGNEWKPLFQKNNPLDLSVKVSYEHFSTQLYKELMLTSVYENI